MGAPDRGSLKPWAPTASLWLLAFDLREPKARRRLEKVMTRFGFLQNQYSLRLGWLTPGETRRLREALDRFEPGPHHILLLPLGRSFPEALFWGTPLGAAQVSWGQVPVGQAGIFIGYP
jgi:CRISPR-associated endonuclease Cas2